MRVAEAEGRGKHRWQDGRGEELFPSVTTSPCSCIMDEWCSPSAPGFRRFPGFSRQPWFVGSAGQKPHSAPQSNSESAVKTGKTYIITFTLWSLSAYTPHPNRFLFAFFSTKSDNLISHSWLKFIYYKLLQYRAFGTLLLLLLLLFCLCVISLLYYYQLKVTLNFAADFFSAQSMKTEVLNITCWKRGGAVLD